jgi:aminoglycoside 3-N-acetyltransferase
MVAAFGPEDLQRSLVQVGVVPGDVLMVHSSFNSFVGFRGTPAAVVRILQDVVGPEGTILMPTLPFSGSAVEYAATEPLFDVRRTVSRMGLITEVFRRSPHVMRSLHPTHSVAAWGARAPELIADHELAGTPCGRATPWGRLLDCDGKVLFVGVSIETMTFYHAIEEALELELPVRLFEPREYAFRCRDEQGNTQVTKTRLFSSRLAGHWDLRPLARELRRRGSWQEARVARLRMILVRAREAFDATVALARRGVFCHDL